jgi:hypothetical protein
MKRKIIFSILTIALLLTMLYACKKDFLDTLPKGSVSETILANEPGVNKLLIGAYSAIDGAINGQESGSWAATPTNWVLDIASDDATKGSNFNDQPSLNVIENYTLLPNNEFVLARWRICYDAISRCNDVLRVMGKCDPALPEATQTSIKAQVLFLRGVFHFQLKIAFNNIPYITEDVVPEEVKNDVDTWPMIEADLQFAVDNLPTSQAEVGRATKYAAEAVLARVSMFQKKWDKAKVLLDDIITSNKYSLMTNFGDNFTAANRNNKESIFEMQYCVNDGSNGSANAGAAVYVNFPIDIDGMGTCCGLYQPTRTLVDAFQVDAGGLPILYGPVPHLKNDMGILSASTFVQDTVTPVDPRLDVSIGRRGIPFLDWGIMRGETWIHDQSNGGPYLNKKLMYLKKDKGILNSATGWNKSSNTNSFRMIRYSHILLWRAEVAVESATPDFAYATTLVNMLRTRANNQKIMGRCRSFILPNQMGLKVDNTVTATNYLVNPYPATFPDLDYARKAVQMEIRLEFAMEGFRHFDLVRWGIAATTINAYLNEDRSFRSLFGGVIPAVFKAGTHEYWPLPQDQIDLQPGVLTQNPGY